MKTDVLGKIIVGNYVSKGGFIYYRNTSSFPIGNDTASHGDYSKYKTNLWGFGIKVCNLDNVRNPYRGIVFEFQADAGRKHGEEEKPVFHSNIFYDISGYIGFAKMFTVKLRNSSKMIYSKTIFGNELLWIGGLNTVRGFDELSLPATYYTLGNIEFRYLLERNSAVYVLVLSGPPIPKNIFTISLSRSVRAASTRSISFESDSSISLESVFGRSVFSSTSTRLLSSPFANGASIETWRPETLRVSEILSSGISSTFASSSEVGRRSFSCSNRE